jgi:hypothetical protein
MNMTRNRAGAMSRVEKAIGKRQETEFVWIQENAKVSQ